MYYSKKTTYLLNFLRPSPALVLDTRPPLFQIAALTSYFVESEKFEQEVRDRYLHLKNYVLPLHKSGFESCKRTRGIFKGKASDSPLSHVNLAVRALIFFIKSKNKAH